MSFSVVINGYGRIGRSLLRVLYSPCYRDLFTVVAINEPAAIETLAYLTRYDTTHGRFPLPVSHEGCDLLIGDDRIRIFKEPDPRKLHWGDSQVDLIFECSGSFDDRDTANLYLEGGADRLLFSHPARPDVDATIIYGINQATLLSEHKIVSTGSCTTNCIVPILDILDREFGICSGVTTTIHSAMNDQPVSDCFHQSSLRLARSALQSIIPVDTGLAKGIERLMPQLANRFQCLHVRVPTVNVSLMDISVNLKTHTDAKRVNTLIEKQAATRLHGLVDFTLEPHASVDFNGDIHSCIVDGTQTRVSQGKLLKLLCWFDNEWAFANRMADVAGHWLSLGPGVK